MKVLHYSDKGVANIAELYEQTDILFSTGDLTVFDFQGVRGKPMFGVYGNHCSGTYFEEVGIVNVHLRVEEFRGYRIGGFEGCVRYKPAGKFLYTQKEASELWENFPPVDILLLHAPPAGLLDEPEDGVHGGFSAVREYIDRHHPVYVFCGHLHEDAELRYGETMILRTFGARIIEIG